MKLSVRLCLLVLLGALLGLLGEWQPWFAAGAVVAPPASPRAPDAAVRRPNHPGTDATLLPTVTPPRDNVLVRFDAWVERYLAAAPGERAALLGEGRALAQARRQALYGLIQLDPEAALAAAVPMVARQHLPAEIVALLEARLSGRGSLAWNGVVPVAGEIPAEPGYRAAVIGREEYRAYVYGRRAAQGSLGHTSLVGIAVDGRMAVDESPLRVLEPGEMSGTRPRVEVCAISGEATAVSATDALNLQPGTGATAVEYDGAVHVLCTPVHVAALRAQLVASEDDHVEAIAAAGGTGSSDVLERPAYSWTHGPKKVLVIRVDFPDLAGPPVTRNGAAITPDLVSNLINGPQGVKAFYAENSFGQTSLELAPTAGGASPDITPVLRMPQTSAYYAGPSIDRSSLLHDDARAAAQAAGFNVGGYDRVGVVFSRLPFPWDGLANIIGRNFWVNADFVFYVVAHELGHSYGLMHSNFWYAADGNPVSLSGQSSEYYDFWDVMGSGNYFQHHFSQWNKSILQWIPDTAVTTVATTGTYRVYRFDHAAANLALPRALKVRRDDLRDYWIGYRRATDEPAFDNGAYVLWGYHHNQQGNLLDLTGAPNTPDDAPLQLGASFTDTAAGITLRTVAQGGSGAEEWLDVEVTLPGGTTPPPTTAGTWRADDIGSVGRAGSSSESNGTITVNGSGADIWNQADGFQFRSQALTGDGTIVARVAAASGANGWAKFGVMFREDFTPGSREVMAFVTPANHAGLQYRLAPDGASVAASDVWSVVPAWLKLVRAGNDFTGYKSTDGQVWTSLGSVTCVMPPMIFVGLAVTSHDNGALATGTFDQVALPTSAPPAPVAAPANLQAGGATASGVTLTWTDNSADESGFLVERAAGSAGAFAEIGGTEPDRTTYVDSGLAANTTYSYRVRARRSTEYSAYSNTALVTTTATPPPPPSGWQEADLGNVGLASSTSVAGSTITVNAAGADLWDAADSGHYVYQAWHGDGEIRAKVARLDNTHPWAKAGVMFRETLAAGSRNVAYVLTAANASGLQVREAAGGLTTFAAGPWVNAPYWIRLVRTGNVFTASTSSDGTTWTVRATQTLALAADLQVGVAVSSHVTSARTTAVFEQVQLPAAPPPPPAGWTQAGLGAGTGSFTANGAALAISATGADLWGQYDDGIFVHQPWTGNGEILARIDSLTNTHPWAKVGVMFRAGTASTAPNVFVGITPGTGATFQVRGASSGVTTEAQHSWVPAAPCWVRLTRAGDSFAAAYSTDGTTWVSLGAQTLALPATLAVGVAVSSHTAGPLAASLSGVQVH